MQIVLFAETKFSKEIVVTEGQKLKDSATYLALYPIQLSGTVAYLLFLQFLAQCCLLVGFCQRICLFVWVFFPEYILRLKSSKPTTVKCEAGYRSPANSLFFCCLYFLTNSISVLATTHPPSMLKMRVSKYLLKFSSSKQQCTVKSFLWKKWTLTTYMSQI